MRSATAKVVLLSGALLAACQHHPTIRYPKLLVAGPVEAGFDCEKLDDAVLKTEAVRWVIRQDGARLISPEERAARTATDVATTITTFACSYCFWPVALGDEGHAVLDMADRRLMSLLKLKDGKRCMALPTAMAGMTDIQLYDTVAELLAREERKDPGTDVGELRAERTRLLDELRP